MIFVRVKAGLGNQMFQYALYKKLKAYYGINKVKLDIGEIEKGKEHNGYELRRVFSISHGEDCSEQINKIIRARGLVAKICKAILLIKKMYLIEKTQLSYKKRIMSLNADKKIYIDGYWQSEKYFLDIKEEILAAFKFKQIIDEKNIKAKRMIENSNSVSIHIRRGDYLKYTEIYGDCDMDYYERAISKIIKLVKEPHFFVFSDDIAWARENLKIFVTHNKIEYSDWNKGKDSYRDMQLMSYCKNNIIANSSFSWWGAWLNTNVDKIVIAPRSWFKGRYVNKDIIPDNWIKI